MCAAVFIESNNYMPDLLRKWHCASYLLLCPTGHFMSVCLIRLGPWKSQSILMCTVSPYVPFSSVQAAVCPVWEISQSSVPAAHQSEGTTTGYTVCEEGNTKKGGKINWQLVNCASSISLQRNNLFICSIPVLHSVCWKQKWYNMLIYSQTTENYSI